MLAGLTRPVFLAVSPDWVLPSVLEMVLTHYCSVRHLGSEVAYALPHPHTQPPGPGLSRAATCVPCLGAEQVWSLGHRPLHSRQTLPSCGPAPMLATARW